MKRERGTERERRPGRIEPSRMTQLQFEIKYVELIFVTAKLTICNFQSFACKTAIKNLYKAIFRIRIFCIEAKINQFLEEHLTWYRVILKKVSFGVFRIILVSKKEKKSCYRKQRQRGIFHQAFMIFGHGQNHQNQILKRSYQPKE